MFRHTYTLTVFILGLAFIDASATAQAAPCATVAGSCAANSVCLSWPATTTRESGVALPAAELKGYELSLDGVVKASQPGLSYTYAVPTDTTLATTSTWSIVAVDTAGLKSTKPFACTQPKAVLGPKSPPSAPTGLGITTAP